MSLLSRSPLDVTNAMWNAESFATEMLPNANTTGKGLAGYIPEGFNTWHFNDWSVTDASNEIMEGGSDKGFHVEPAAGYTVVMKVNPLPTDIGQVPFGPTGEITLNPGDKLLLNKCPNNNCTMQFYYTPAGGTQIETAKSRTKHTVDLISVTKASNGSTNGSTGGSTNGSTNGENGEEEDLTCTDDNSEPNADGDKCVCKDGFALDEDEDSDTFGTCIESGMGTGTKLAIALGGVALLGGGIWYAVKQPKGS